MQFMQFMAGETDKIDIFVIDNNPNRSYIELLREAGFVLDVIISMGSSEKQRFYDTKARVLIFGYGQNSGRGSGEIRRDDPVLVSACGCPLSGIELAKIVHQWGGDSKYIHIVSSQASEERPAGCESSWKELLEKNIISSYSGRDRDSFCLHLRSIEDALKER